MIQFAESRDRPVWMRTQSGYRLVLQDAEGGHGLVRECRDGTGKLLEPSSLSTSVVQSRFHKRGAMRRRQRSRVSEARPDLLQKRTQAWQTGGDNAYADLDLGPEGDPAAFPTPIAGRSHRSLLTCCSPNLTQSDDGCYER